MQSALCIGVDVAKDNVVVACSRASFATRTVPNKPASLKTFLRSLPAQSCIAMEATGRYHQELADLAHQQGLRVYVLNPGTCITTPKAWACAPRPTASMPP